MASNGSNLYLSLSSVEGVAVMMSAIASILSFSEASTFVLSDIAMRSLQPSM